MQIIKTSLSLETPFGVFGKREVLSEVNGVGFLLFRVDYKTANTYMNIETESGGFLYAYYMIYITLGHKSDKSSELPPLKLCISVQLSSI